MNAKLVMVGLVAFSSLSQAYQYDCNVKGLDGKNSRDLGQFIFNPVQEPNKFISVGWDLQAGCVKLESQQPLIACTLGSQHSKVTVVSDLGAKIVVLESTANEQGVNLTCLRKD